MMKKIYIYIDIEREIETEKKRGRKRKTEREEGVKNVEERSTGGATERGWRKRGAEREKEGKKCVSVLFYFFYFCQELPSSFPIHTNT